MKHLFSIALVGFFACFQATPAQAQGAISKVLSRNEGAQWRLNGAYPWVSFYGDKKFLVMRSSGDIQRWSTSPLKAEAVVLNAFQFAQEYLPDANRQKSLGVKQGLRQRLDSIRTFHDLESGHLCVVWRDSHNPNHNVFHLFGPEIWTSSVKVAPKFQWRSEGTLGYARIMSKPGFLVIPKSGRGSRTEVELRTIEAPESVHATLKIAGNYGPCWWDGDRGFVFASRTDQFKTRYVVSKYDLERKKVRKIGTWQLPEHTHVGYPLEQVGEALVWSSVRSRAGEAWHKASVGGSFITLGPGHFSLQGAGVFQPNENRLVTSESIQGTPAVLNFALIDIKSAALVSKWKGAEHEFAVALSQSGRFLLSYCGNDNPEENGLFLRDFHDEYQE